MRPNCYFYYYYYYFFSPWLHHFTLVTVSAIVFIFVFSAVSNRTFERLHAHIKPLQRFFAIALDSCFVAS